MEIPFVTTYDDPNINDIYSCSDIHGDIEALLIELEHCAKVIRPTLPDEQIRMHLNNDNYDAIMEGNTYLHDLGYTWCGNSKYIVIVGDLMDRARFDNNLAILENAIVNIKLQTYDANGEVIRTKTGKPVYGVTQSQQPKHCGEYPYEELKLILFLNSLCMEAERHNGKIIRLSGNHEFSALEGRGQAYNSKYTMSLQYVNSQGRFCTKLDFFKKGNPGAKLLYGNGMGAVVKIHDYIFVHGGIVENTIGDIKLNNLHTINNLFTDFYNSQHPLHQPFFMGVSGLLYDRSYSPDPINKIGNICDKGPNASINYGNIIFNNCTWSRRDEGHLCASLDNAFLKLCNGNGECANSLKLVVGHCPQNNDNELTYGNSRMKNYHYSTVTNLGDSEIISPPCAYNWINIPKGIIYGITLDCIKNVNDQQLPSLYRIDIGVSKAFDQINLKNGANEVHGYAKLCVLRNNKKLPLESIGKLFYIYDTLMQRLPQMLNIKCKLVNDKMTYETSVVRVSFPIFIEKMTRKYLTHDAQNTETNIVKLLLLDFHKYIYNTDTNPEEHPTRQNEIIYGYRISDETFLQISEICHKIYDIRRPADDTDKQKYAKYKAKYLALKKYKPV